MKNIYPIILLISILILSCTNASESDLIDIVQPPVIVTYEDDVKIIISNNCLNCHQQPPVNGATVPLLLFNHVKNAVENQNLIGRISAQAGDAGAMPFGGPRLPQNLIDIIIQWEADGLLEQ